MAERKARKAAKLCKKKGVPSNSSEKKESESIQDNAPDEVDSSLPVNSFLRKVVQVEDILKNDAKSKEDEITNKINTLSIKKEKQVKSPAPSQEPVENEATKSKAQLKADRRAKQVGILSFERI